MARTIKYQKNFNISANPAPLTKTGIYTRISVPDGDDVSESVVNQIQLAMNYINHSEDRAHLSGA